MGIHFRPFSKQYYALRMRIMPPFNRYARQESEIISEVE